LLALLGTVALRLLIACVNIANLLFLNGPGLLRKPHRMDTALSACAVDLIGALN
jgi:hypothetical protein